MIVIVAVVTVIMVSGRREVAVGVHAGVVLMVMHEPVVCVWCVCGGDS